MLIYILKKIVLGEKNKSYLAVGRAIVLELALAAQLQLDVANAAHGARLFFSRSIWRTLALVLAVLGRALPRVASLMARACLMKALV